MTKLQKIERKNGTIVYPINIPVAIIYENDWDKGTLLEFISLRKGEILIKEMK